MRTPKGTGAGNTVIKIHELLLIAEQLRRVVVPHVFYEKYRDSSQKDFDFLFSPTRTKEWNRVRNKEVWC